MKRERERETRRGEGGEWVVGAPAHEEAVLSRLAPALLDPVDAVVAHAGNDLAIGVLLSRRKVRPLLLVRPHNSQGKPQLAAHLRGKWAGRRERERGGERERES